MKTRLKERLSFKATLAILCYFTFITFLFFYIFCYKTLPGPADSIDNIGSLAPCENSTHNGVQSCAFFNNEATNISHILFGINGFTDTWHNRRKYSELWWKHDTTRGFVWLNTNPFEEGVRWPENSPPYKVSADTSGFLFTHPGGLRSAVRAARILKESFELRLENVRWFVMGDDDTVFFTENLVNVLSKYDHNQMYYIGANSEDVFQDVTDSYNFAFGGAGFAISYTLAAALVKILDGCINRYHDVFGSDTRVAACVTEIGVPLTREPGFHQFDLRGDPYGYLAAHPLAPLVSLHHLDEVGSIFPDMDRHDSLKLLHTAYQSDPGRTLQQTICYDLQRNWSMSVSWGYTVQLYPSLKKAMDLNTAFLTFKSWVHRQDGPFIFNTRPWSSNPCERPVIYLLDQIEKKGKEETLTTYKRHVQFKDSEKDCSEAAYAPALGIESMKVSAVTFKPAWWKKAPRRQCCEVINSNEDKHTMELRIRRCRQYESVTLPQNY